MKLVKVGKAWSRFLAFLLTLVLLLSSPNGNGFLLSQALASSTGSLYSDLLSGVDLGDGETKTVATAAPVPTTASVEPATVMPTTETDASSPATGEDTETSVMTEQPAVVQSTAPSGEATPTVASDAATPQPETAPLSLQDIIRSANHAYLITAGSKAGVYSGYGMNNAQRIGTLNGSGTLVFATDYVPREGNSAAVLVWFDTDSGVTSGYVSEDRLGTEPMNATEAAEYISQNRLDTCDFVLSDVHYTLVKAGYTPQTDAGESMTTEDLPVLYRATIANVQGGIASLFEAANSDSAVCAAVQAGETVSVVREADGWVYVLAEDGDQGYLPSGNLQTADTQTAIPENQPTASATVTVADGETPASSDASSIDQLDESATPAIETPSAIPADPSSLDTQDEETASPEASSLPTPTLGSSLDDLNGEDVEPSVSPDAEPSVTPEMTDAEPSPSESLEPSATPDATVSPLPLSELPAAVTYAVVTLPSGTTPLYAEANPVAAIIDQLANGTYVGVLAVDNDWAHVYVRKGEGFLEGYLANNILTLSALSTGEPIPTPAPVMFIPMQPEGLPEYYLSIGIAKFDTSFAPTEDTAPAEDAATVEEVAPAEDTAPVTDAPQDANLLGMVSRFFFSSACAEETGTTSADIYTFIGADGVQYYRVYGTVNGVEGYYACDENGTLLEPYQLVDIVAEQETLTNDTPSISTRGLVNFSLSSSATPTTIPAYYTSFPAGENTTVYTFVGRDGVTYYRIYGTNTSGQTGFFACDQYGENESASPIVLNDEFNTIAPYVYASLSAPSMPTGLTLVSSNPYLYSYPAADGTTQYRIYGVKLNDPTDTDKHWYATDATGTVTEPLLNDDIQLDMNNLWANGFIEAANPAAAVAPSFYGLVGGTDNTDTIKARQTMWAYTDRTGVVRYRVYGTVNGVAGFYECDADGNVLSLTPVDLANEQLYLSPLKNGIADDYIPGYAKVISTNVTSITDGTPVWDSTTSGINTATLGNDSSPSNKVVRSFDQVAYELDYVTELNTVLPDGTDISNYKGFNSAKAYMRFEVPVTLENDVSFVLGDM